ncbi:MAG: hypothetical protein LUG21_02545 [Clostridiales bacterium]|nr:hypothetical protein [Clostridiales bacterium]
MSNEKKSRLSKKKKIIIIVVSLLAVLIAAALTAGLCVLNWYCKTPDFSISQTTANVKLIAHRGFRAVAPENTAPAYEEAGKAGYYGAECDIYRTSDGVWVLHHDPVTYRMMDGLTNLENHTYQELLEQTVDNGSNIDEYTDLKVCTLDEYLALCVKYNMIPVIELKGKNNTEHYDEIISSVNKYSQVKPVFISFHLDNLKKMRKLTDLPCWYLVQKISDDEIQNALSIGGECGIDFNYAKKENTDELILKCIDTGMSVGAWTVNDVSAAERLAGLGVEYITTDSITE